MGNFVNETIGVVISFTFDKHLSLTRLRPSHFGGVLVNEGERATKRLMNEVVMSLGPAPYDSLLRSSPIKSVIKIVAAFGRYLSYSLMEFSYRVGLKLRKALFPASSCNSDPVV